METSRRNCVDIHKMTLEKLPKYELFEEGSQIRRSSKAVNHKLLQDMEDISTLRIISDF